MKFEAFDYEENIPAIRETFISRNIEVGITPDLNDLAAEFGVPVAIINRFYLSEDWETERNEAKKHFNSSIAKIRKEDIDKRALILMNEVSAMTKDTIDWIGKLKPILLMRVLHLVEDENEVKKLKPADLAKFIEIIAKQEAWIVDLAIKIKSQLDDNAKDDDSKTNSGAALIDKLRSFGKVLIQKDETEAERQLFDKLDAS